MAWTIPISRVYPAMAEGYGAFRGTRAFPRSPCSHLGQWQIAVQAREGKAERGLNQRAIYCGARTDPAERRTLVGNLAPRASLRSKISSRLGSALSASLPFHHELQVFVYAPGKFLAGCHIWTESTCPPFPIFCAWIPRLSDAFACPVTCSCGQFHPAPLWAMAWGT